MSKKRVDLRFTFDATEDGPELLTIRILDSELDDNKLDMVAEAWGQSDRYSVDIVAGIIEVFGGDTYTH